MYRDRLNDALSVADSADKELAATNTEVSLKCGIGAQGGAFVADHASFSAGYTS